jgi:ligand-binding sensor domain-containing protein
MTANLIQAQSSYMIKNYTKQEYQAGSQNWSVDTDKDGFLYVGNNDGLLVFDGTHWKTYRSPDQTIVRSVFAASDHKIYTGSYEEFGFWQRKQDKSLEYQSLKPLLKNAPFHNSEIWKIVENQGKIYFQSFSSLYVYDNRSIKSIDLPGSVIFLLQAGNRLFIQSVQGFFYEIINDKLVRIDTGSELVGTEVKTILPYTENSFLIGTTSNGLFLFDGVHKIIPFVTDVDPLLRQYQVNNGLIHEGKILLGTIVNGIMILDKQGRLIDHLHSQNAIQNNTVLSLCAAPGGAVWAGLDRGIDKLISSDLIQVYQEKGGDLGAVYTAALKDDHLYIGTNRGIFIYNDNMKTQRFEYSGFLENSQGQVWTLKMINGTLFCGHTSGTYIVEGDRIRKISSVSGGFNLHEYQSRNFTGLIQSTYSPLVVYEKAGKDWYYSHQVMGFLEPSRFMEPDHLGNIWVGHAVKGLYKLRMDNGLKAVSSTVLFGKKDGLPADFNLRVFKVANRVVVTTGTAIYTWNDLTGKLILFDELNKYLNGFESASQIVAAGENQYWFIRKNDMALFEITENRVRQVFNLFLPLYGLNMVDGYENLVPIDKGRTLICLDNGFAIVNSEMYKQNGDKSGRLLFRDVYLIDSDGNRRMVLPDSASFKVGHDWNTVSITFTVINTHYYHELYQFKLKGIDNDWSDWTSEGEITYSRLPKGEYEFLVRTFTGGGQVSDPIVLKFSVKAAWYLSSVAYVVYSLVLVLIFLWSRYLFRRRVVRQHLRLQQEAEAKALLEKQQAEQEIIKLQNEKLQVEISHKNIQLADSTVAIIRKNELLIEIKDEVSRQQEKLAAKNPDRKFDRLLSLINKNISSDSDWKIFEALFDQAHENFFKRLKTAYPELTQSDLKMCAYLRLNLTSKEIAPLLNITFRGVETRRYRLRSRLSLDADANLVEFIMQF